MILWKYYIIGIKANVGADTQRSPLLRGDWGLQSSHSVAAAPQRGANPPFATEGEG